MFLHSVHGNPPLNREAVKRSSPVIFHQRQTRERSEQKQVLGEVLLELLKEYLSAFCHIYFVFGRFYSVCVDSNYIYMFTLQSHHASMCLIQSPLFLDSELKLSTFSIFQCYLTEPPHFQVLQFSQQCQACCHGHDNYTSYLPAHNEQ